VSSQIIKISRPTKIELLRLRKRLALARRYYNLLKDRETLLLQTLRDTLVKLIEARTRLNKLLREVAESYSTALSIYGWNFLEAQSRAVGYRIILNAKYKNVLGVWTLHYEPAAEPLSEAHLVPELAQLQLVRGDVVKTLSEVISYERTIVNIGMEIARLKRIVNMLEKVYIPRLERTIKYLSMKFDEAYREDVVRIIRIKRMLEARSVGEASKR